MSTYPTNVLSDYTVKLPKMFDLDDYECALEEIITPTQVLNVRKGLNKFRVSRKNPDTEEITDLGTWEVPPAYYPSLPELIKAINIGGLRNFQSFSSSGTAIPAFELAYKSKRVTLLTPGSMRVEFGSDLATLLGYPLLYGSTGEAGVYTAPIANSDAAEFPSPPMDTLSAMYIYTDLIKDQYVGGTSAPLLRIINVTRADWRNQRISRTYVNPHFAPLKKARFDSINVQIRDDSGHPLHFRYGKVIVVLAFRKRAI
jgi:hypothetical protein